MDELNMKPDNEFCEKCGLELDERVIHKCKRPDEIEPKIIDMDGLI